MRRYHDARDLVGYVMATGDDVASAVRAAESARDRISIRVAGTC